MIRIILLLKLFIVTTLLVVSCKKDKDNSNNNDQSNSNDQSNVAKGTLLFHMHTYIEDTEVDAYNVDMMTYAGRIISLSRAQFYISGIQLVKLDGSTVDLQNNVIKLFESEGLTIGEVPVGNYKSVRFKVGLNATTNALLPSFSSDSIILKMQQMWFGSSAQPDGYVFMNVQGNIDTTNAVTGTPVPFCYKIGTNENYVSVSMPIQNFTVLKDNVNYVHMIVDYSKLFDGIDLTNPSNLNVSSAQDNSSSIATMIKNNIPNLFRYE